MFLSIAGPHGFRLFGSPGIYLQKCAISVRQQRTALPKGSLESRFP